MNCRVQRIEVSKSAALGAALQAGTEVLKSAEMIQGELNSQAEQAAKVARELQARVDRVNYLITLGTPEALDEIRKLGAS